ncbi:hypothetical protein ACM66B_005608 [Microbotryomycetes sp. NB124-2]
MKITINHYHGIAVWRWNLKHKHPPTSASTAAADKRDNVVSDEDDEEEDQDDDDDDDDDDVCGICRVAFDGCCPECKVPGDGCPLIWGECTHVFHMHCLLKWLSTDSSKQQCPLDRRPWVTVGSETDKDKDRKATGSGGDQSTATTTAEFDASMAVDAII